MRKFVIFLFLISSLLQARGLWWIKGRSGEMSFQFLTPEEVFVRGKRMKIKGWEVDLGELKARRRIQIKDRDSEVEIWVEPFRLNLKNPSSGAYRKMRLRVRGEDDVSINIPLWLLRVFMWFASHVDMEGDTHGEEALVRGFFKFLKHPEQYVGGYIGPLKFAYFKDEDEEVEIVFY